MSASESSGPSTSVETPPETGSAGGGGAARPGKPPCPNCGGVSSRAFTTRDWNRKITDQDFTYYRCRGCGLVFLWPIPTDLGRYYPLDYYGGFPTIEEMAGCAEWERYKITMVGQYSSGGKLLEIGPGGGGFAYLAKRAGFEVNTIEMSPEICRYLIEVIGVGAINETDPGPAILAGGNQDVIAAWHVIEHLPDPWPMVEAAAARLNPGGLLVLAAPNPDSFQFKILGSKWPHVDAPRHLQLIPLSVLDRRAKGLGLSPLLVTTSDEGTIYWNQVGWEKGLPGLLPRRPGRIFNRLVPVLARLSTRHFRHIEQKGSGGSAYTVIYRKD